MKEDEDQARAAAIYQRFRQAQREMRRKSFWESWSLQGFSLFIGVILTVCLILLEPLLLVPGWPPILRIPGAVALALLPALPVNGWLLSRFLAGKTLGERRVPVWQRALRFVAVSVPLVGWLTLVAWRDGVVRSGRAGSGSAPLLDLESPPAGRKSRPRLLEWLYRSGIGQLWLAVSGALPPLLWALWLGSEANPGAGRRAVLLIVCVALHLAAAACMAGWLSGRRSTEQTAGQKDFILRSLPFLWLLPMPIPLLGCFAMVFLVNEFRTAVPLTWSAHAARYSAYRPRKASGPPSPGQGDEHRLTLIRLKTLLLLAEVTAVTEILTRWAAGQPARVEAVERGLWVFGSVAVCLAAFGLCVRIRSLVLTQTATAVGLLMGFLLGLDQDSYFGLTLYVFGLMGALISPFVLMLQRRSDLRDLVWPFPFVALAFFGVVLAGDSAHRSFQISFLTLALRLSPLASLALGLSLGGWLLHPFAWQQIFDRKFPRRRRIVLALLALTALLPLGGLFIPLWIFARRNLARVVHYISSVG